MTLNEMIKKVNKQRKQGAAMFWELDRLMKEEEERVLKEQQKERKPEDKKAGGE